MKRVPVCDSVDAGGHSIVHDVGILPLASVQQQNLTWPPVRVILPDLNSE